MAPRAGPTKNKRNNEKFKKSEGAKSGSSTDRSKFDSRAKVNAEPRKITEPEPIVRASKPLGELKKSIDTLSRPQKRSESLTRSNVGVSKSALTARPSKRVLELAKPAPKVKTRAGRKFPRKISKAALRYKASKRIIEISKPSVMPISDHCKRLVDITRDIPSRKTITRRARFLLAKKAVECPLLLTDEELDILVTPTGVYRTALTYKFTPWMELLSLPSYKFLKDRYDDDAIKWKEFIIEESYVRGKKALEAKRRKAERKKKRQGEREKENVEPLDERQEIEEESQKPEEGEEMPKDEAEETPESRIEDTAKGEEEEMPKSDEAEIVETKEDAEEVEEAEKQPRKETGNDEVSEETVEKRPAYAEAGKSTASEKRDETFQEKQAEEEDEKAARRKAARNAWRYSPPPCKSNPFAIKRSALKGKVSPRMAELAVRTLPKYIGCKKNPFAVKKSALTGPIPEGVSRLAKPNHPRDPIERPPPREKDSFGRPIYPKPPYGRKMPSVSPIKPAECPDKEKKDDDEEAKKKERKRRFIDPIVYEATIDPCIDPERSKRQIKARKAAKEEFKRRKEADEKNKEKSGEKGEEKSEEEGEEKRGIARQTRREDQREEQREENRELEREEIREPERGETREKSEDKENESPEATETPDE